MASLDQTIFSFLNKHYDLSRPLLLALSGGPDSLALLHLLLDYRKIHPLALGIVHVDHGWRAESSEEANLLQQMTRAFDLPFYLKRLHPKDLLGNLEAACREERLKFFSAICRQHGYQAVVLAHHADDQTETVLKRVLEGVSLPYLSSMQPLTTVEGVTIWRPLLSIRKKEIVSWLEARGLKGFDDSTNLDPKFLRGRLRAQLLPLLSKEFGKEVGTSLEHLGSQAAFLREYLDDRTKTHRQRIQNGPLGLFLDLSMERPEHPYELSYLIRKFCEEATLTLSRQAHETVLQLVLSGAADKQIDSGSYSLKIDRSKLFLPNFPCHIIQERKPLLPGTMSIGPWRISVREFEGEPSLKTATNWRDAWLGRGEVFLPSEEGYEMGEVHLQSSYRGHSTISKWWTNAKVPAFLRKSVPVVWKKGQICHEFLTGRSGNPDLPESKRFVFVKKWLHVLLDR